MKIILLLVGKTTEKFIEEGVNEYEKRVKRSIPFEIKIIPFLKKSAVLSKDEVKQKEGELILQAIDKSDFLVLLDEKGKDYSSLLFAEYISKQMNSSIKTLIFVVGGAYGFSEDIYKRANSKISLSKMTFSHQLVRILFMEQLYRAFTIIKGEPYHHE